MQYAIFIDIESNGLDPALHRCLEVAFRVVDVRTGEEKIAYSSLVKQDEATWARSDLVSLSINEFTWEQVQQGKNENEVRQDIITALTNVGIHRSNAFFLAQNPAFDRAFFSQLISISQQDRYQWPYHWLDFASMYWAICVKKAQVNEEGVVERMTADREEVKAAKVSHETAMTATGCRTTTGCVAACSSLSKDAIAATYGLLPEQKPHRAMRGVEHLIMCYAQVVGWWG